MIAQELQDAFRYREVVFNHVYTALTVKYKRSFIGYLWTILAPLLRYFVMGMVFYRIGRMQDSGYFAHMFAGSVFFGFFQASLVGGSTVFIANEHFIKKIYVPKLTFVFNVVGYELVNFALVLLGVMALGLITGQFFPGFTLPLALVAVVLTALTLVGLALTMGIATVFFRDLTHITDVLTQILFFASPIFTYPEQLPHWIVKWNPMYYYLSIFRDPVIHNRAPNLLHVGICLVLTLISLSLGLLLLRKFANRIVYKL